MFACRNRVACRAEEVRRLVLSCSALADHSWAIPLLAWCGVGGLFVEALLHTVHPAVALRYGRHSSKKSPNFDRSVIRCTGCLTCLRSETSIVLTMVPRISPCLAGPRSPSRNPAANRSHVDEHCHVMRQYTWEERMTQRETRSKAFAYGML